jgi:hypothetical protein
MSWRMEKLARMARSNRAYAIMVVYFLEPLPSDCWSTTVWWSKRGCNELLLAPCFFGLGAQCLAAFWLFMDISGSYNCEDLHWSACELDVQYVTMGVDKNRGTCEGSS